MAIGATIFGIFIFIRIPFLCAGEEIPIGEDAQNPPSWAAAAVEPADRAVVAGSLHRARLIGDEAQCRRIEALLPRQSLGGESTGGTKVFPTRTVSLEADPAEAGIKNPEQTGRKRSLSPFFGDDRKVRSSNGSWAESSPAMASDSMGNLYVAWEDNQYAHTYIVVYKSANGGETWAYFGGVIDAAADLREPSIAVGEGLHGDKLLLAYITDNGTDIPVPEVAMASLSGGSFTAYSVPVWTAWEGYRRPVITTDAIRYTTWIAYLTCEGVYDSATDNINVCSFRSLNGGTTWGTSIVPLGNYDDFAWLDPDLSFGTSMDRVFIAAYNWDSNKVNAIWSDSFAYDWEAPVIVDSLYPSRPLFPVDPEIAAAVDNDHVMVCCTRRHATDTHDDISYSCSLDAGATWTNLYTLPGCTERNEHAAALTACEGGGSWHLAYTQSGTWGVFYSCRPQDMSSGWLLAPWRVDDMGTTGSLDSLNVKGIAAIRSTDTACVAWSDYRDGGPGDLDVYADFGSNTGLMTNSAFISAASGGWVQFVLNAGSKNSGRTYLLLAGLSGTSPGTMLPGGMALLPLNLDAFTFEVVFPLINTQIFQNFMGTLDSAGAAFAYFLMPPIVFPGYLDIHFAGLLGFPYNWVSNPVTVAIFP